MDGAFFGLICGSQVEEGLEFELVSVKRSRDIYAFTPHDYDSLTIKELLGYNRSKTAKEVSLTVNDN